MHTLVVVVRIILLGMAACAGLLHVVFGVRAVNSARPTGALARRLIATFLPLRSRESDYVERGWYYHKAQNTCRLVFAASLFAWVFIGAFGL